MGRMATRRRWLQFSIRILLAVVTPLCVALSLWTVAAIEALGGIVDYADNEEKGESFPLAVLELWPPQVYGSEVASVDRGNSQVTDAELARLKGRTRLQFLDLNNTQVTDAGLAHLKGMTGLRQLWLNNTQVTDAGLAHLQGLTSLQRLYLENTQVTDAGLAHLQGLTGLQRLYLDNTQVMDAGLAHLKALTDLQWLRLDNTQVTDAGLGRLQGLLRSSAAAGARNSASRLRNSKEYEYA